MNYLKKFNEAKQSKPINIDDYIVGDSRKWKDSIIDLFDDIDCQKIIENKVCPLPKGKISDDKYLFFEIDTYRGVNDEVAQWNRYLFSQKKDKRIYYSLTIIPTPYELDYSDSDFKIDDYYTTSRNQTLETEIEDLKVMLSERESKIRSLESQSLILKKRIERNQKVRSIFDRCKNLGIETLIKFYDGDIDEIMLVFI